MHTSAQYLRIDKHPEDLRRLFEPIDDIIFSHGSRYYRTAIEHGYNFQPILGDSFSTLHIETSDSRTAPQRYHGIGAESHVVPYSASNVPQDFLGTRCDFGGTMPKCRCITTVSSLRGYTMANDSPYPPSRVATRIACPTFTTLLIRSSSSI